MKNNLAKLLEKWHPAGASQKKSPPPPPEPAPPPPAESETLTFDMDALQHFEEEKQPGEKPGQPRRESGEELNADEILEFFNRIESAEVSEVPNFPPPKKEQQSPKKISTGRADWKKKRGDERKEEEKAGPAVSTLKRKNKPAAPPNPAPIVPAEKEECVFLSGIDEVPVGSTGDVLQSQVDKDGAGTEVPKQDWSKQFAWDQDVEQANRLIFSHETFLPQQREAVNAAKSKADVLFAGSGGKLVYQLCAATDDGITVVVLPTSNSVSDHTARLTFLGVGNSIFVGRTQIPESTKSLLAPADKLSHEALHQLHTAKTKIVRFVVAEAHCISQWSRDFRLAYQQTLSYLRDEFVDVPILALTSVATDVVKDDICKQLKLKSPTVFRGAVDRGNIYYEVRAKGGKGPDVGELVKTQAADAAGIVYCSSRRECEELAKILRGNHKLTCEVWHPEASEDEKKAIQQHWTDGRVRLVVATEGFEADRADVRFVVHHSVPRSMEVYALDCARAGRDGQPSVCVVYYDFGDKSALDSALAKRSEQGTAAAQYSQANVYRMLDYCEEQYVCRRKLLRSFFGAPLPADGDCKDACDNCRLRKTRGVIVGFQKEAELAAEFVREASVREKRRVTIGQAVDYLRGRHRLELTTEKYFGALGRQLSLQRTRAILLKLLVNRVCVVHGYFTGGRC